MGSVGCCSVDSQDSRWASLGCTLGPLVLTWLDTTSLGVTQKDGPGLTEGLAFDSYHVSLEIPTKLQGTALHGACSSVCPVGRLRRLHLGV